MLVICTETGDSDLSEKYSIVLERPMVTKGPAIVGLSKRGEIVVSAII